MNKHLIRRHMMFADGPAGDGGGDGGGGAGGDGGFKPITSQTELDRTIGPRLERARSQVAEQFADYDALKEAAGKVGTLEEQVRTESERATKAEERALRAEVANTKGVPATLLTGATQAELEASADALLAFKGTTPGTGPVVPGEGQHTPSPTDPKRAFLRELMGNQS